MLSGLPRNEWHVCFRSGAVSSIEDGVETTSTPRACCTVLRNAWSSWQKVYGRPLSRRKRAREYSLPDPGILLSVERKAGSGCPAKIVTKKEKEALKKLFHKDGTSVCDTGRKYHCSHTLIHRTLKMENIICQKNTRSPEYTVAICSSVYSADRVFFR